MITAMGKGSGVSKAAIVCDECARQEVITCDYERKGRAMEWHPDEGQARTKMAGKGWTFLKMVDRCPACEAKRKAFKPKPDEHKKEVELTNVTDLRQPTREQRRAIAAILDDCYDVAAGRYKGAETDVTVADAVGGGCMFGWVAEIRMQAYGDSGDNEESGKVAAELDALRQRGDELQTALTTYKLDVSRAMERQAAYGKTLGPKARAI